MASIKLNASGDIEIIDGNMSIARGSEALRQQLETRFRSFRGDWFLDTRIGMPYFQEILIKNPDFVAVRGIFREAILETPGVLEIQKFDLDFDGLTRRLSVSFSVRTEEGLILEFSDAFIVGGDTNG